MLRTTETGTGSSRPSTPLSNAQPQTLSIPQTSKPLSDRQKGLLEVVASIFPESAHGYCIKHLERNFRKNFKDPTLGNLLWKAAKATTKEEYDEAMANMGGTFCSITTIPLLQNDVINPLCP